MWFLGFSLVYFSGSRTIFKDNQPVAGAVAFVFASITAVFVDPKVLLATGALYTVAFQIFLRIAVFIISAYFTFHTLSNLQPGFVRFIVQMFLVIITVGLYILMRDILLTF